MMLILDFTIILKIKMKISYNWIKSYFSNGLMDKIISPIPSPEKLSELINANSFEVEGVEKVNNDFVLDIDILPNRSSDCMCHYGIAKEISAIINKPLKQYFFKEISDTAEKNFGGAKVEVETKNCHRYALALFENVDNTIQTPKYIVERLSSLGQRSVNPIVDITNYIMFELGSPLHAYDKESIGDGARVRMADEGESIKLLGGDEKILTRNDMVICDYNKNSIIGIAGVKGSDGSGASKDTKNIYLEIASFDANTIRHTSRRHDLYTEASSRFAQSPSDLIIPNVLERAISMIVDITGAKLSGVTYYKDTKDPLFYIGTNRKDVRRLLGVDISLEKCKSILDRLNLNSEIIQNPRESILKDAKTLCGSPYSCASSVIYDAPNVFDCSSFVTYLFCRFGIQCPRLSCNQYLFSKRIDKKDVRPGDLVFSYRETEGNIIHRSKKAEDFVYEFSGDIPEPGVSHVGIMDSDNYVIHCTGSKGKNCVVKEKLDDTLSFKNLVGFGRIEDIDIPHLVCKRPIERTDLKYSEDLIEEIGRIYGYENIPTKVFNKSKGGVIQKRIAYHMAVVKILQKLDFVEIENRTFSNIGKVEVVYPQAKDKNFLRTNLSVDIEEALEKNQKNKDLFGKKDIRLIEFGTVFTNNGEFFNMAISITKSKKQDEMFKKVIDELSKIGIGLDIKNKIKNTIEINFDEIISNLETPKGYDYLETYKDKTFSKFSQYPFITRDISMFVPKNMDESNARQIIRNNSKYLENIFLFDIYTKDEKTSLAFKLIFQSYKKTLTDKEINTVMQDIENKLKNKGCVIR